MITRKSLLVLVATLLLAVGLSACMPGTPMAAGMDVEISMDEAMAGQNAVMSSLMTGELSITNSQASSLITELMKQNGVNAVEISAITADMMDGKNSIGIELASPVGGIDSLGVTGSAMAEGGVVSVDLSHAYAGAIGVDEAVLGPISDQINAALASMAMPLPDGPIGLDSMTAGMLNDMMASMGLNSAEISAVKTSFDGGKIHVVAELANGGVMGIDSLGASGALMLDGGSASVQLDEAFAGGLVADSGLVGMVGAQINGMLNAYAFPPASVSADGGSLMVGP
ncbi:hypothetical protein KFU94_11555 [Chloroflexi bacterium TSY]|nr:hypothetical protein [Chloroflexi bacterium TSY]